MLIRCYLRHVNMRLGLALNNELEFICVYTFTSSGWDFIWIWRQALIIKLHYWEPTYATPLWLNKALRKVVNHWFLQWNVPYYLKKWTTSWPIKKKQNNSIKKYFSEFTFNFHWETCGQKGEQLRLRFFLKPLLREQNTISFMRLPGGDFTFNYYVDKNVAYF